MANNITLTGRLTADAELRTTPTGISVCSFTLAVSRPHTKDTTDFIPCQVWRQGADYLTKYGTKGSMVAVTGALTTRKWQDQNGNNRITYEVTCSSVELLGSRTSGDNANAPQTASGSGVPYNPNELEEIGDDEELPF